LTTRPMKSAFFGLSAMSVSFFS
ncbi:MAG: hypothetical protein QOE82_27, partial [Thermoanaerobaculia bacterium]|nr:hypothetical protein [Thermoanaerobaculia bacterium]